MQDTSGRLINDSCDTFATILHDSETFLHHPTHHMTAFLKYQNKNITTGSFKPLIDPIQTQQYLQYLATKFQWNDNTTQNIDWGAIKKAQRNLNLYAKISINKFTHKWRPTNKKLFQTKNNETHSPRCPICHIADEDNDHIYHCIYHTMIKFQVKTLHKIPQLLETNKTHSLITGMITHHLYTWMKLKHTTHLICFNTKVNLHKIIQQAILDQNDIGWDQFICGRIRIHWSKANIIFQISQQRKDIQHTT